MADWFYQHPWITFFLIYGMMTYVYNKVFRMRKLPILKNLIVYLLVAVGAYILWIFQLTLELPIVACLAIAILLMVIVRIRYWVTERQTKPKV